MKIILEIKKGRIRIILRKKQGVSEEIFFKEEKNLSEKLLPILEKMLKKNKLKPQDIQNFQVESDLGENFTTFRLAQTVAQSFVFANKKVKTEKDLHCG